MDRHDGPGGSGIGTFATESSLAAGVGVPAVAAIDASDLSTCAVGRLNRVPQ